MKHNSKEVSLEFDLPGFSRKDIKVNVTNEGIAVSAEKKIREKNQEKRFFS